LQSGYPTGLKQSGSAAKQGSGGGYLFDRRARELSLTKLAIPVSFSLHVKSLVYYFLYALG